MNITLKGKRALIGGATQGIGSAIARLMAEAGAEITIIARDSRRAKQTVASLYADEGTQHKYAVADFDEPELLPDAVRSVSEPDKPFHILVNNSGGPAGGLLAEASPADFFVALKRHLIASHLLVQELLPGMKKEEFGRVINVVSTSVKQPIPGLGVSNTTRGAVASWAKTLAGETARFGITVNSILPGATKTGRLETIIAKKAEKKGSDVWNIEQEEIASIPAGRFGKPEEVAALAVFLASDFAAYINGTAIAVDGGRTACL